MTIVHIINFVAFESIYYATKMVLFYFLWFLAIDIMFFIDALVV